MVKPFKRLPQQPPVNERGVNPFNLTQIKPVASASSHRHFKCEFPTFFLSNAQSVVNKLDEFELLLHQEPVDVAVNTESWFRPNVPDYARSIDGYELFSKSRNDIANVSDRGGGVAVYVKSQITASDISEILVPNDLECVWTLVQPKRLPRDTSVIAVCGVYIPRDSPHQDLHKQHLLESMDHLHTKYPDIGFAITEDFNRMTINHILKNCNLKQLVTFPTRGDATLDLIMTNFSVHYKDPVNMPALGKSDHVCILWRPKVPVVKHQSTKRTYRPMKDSQLREFGVWIQDEDWSNVLSAENTQQKS